MQRWFTISLICLVSCLSHEIGNVKGESQIPPRPGVLDSKSSVDDALNALQASGKDVKSFTADIQDTEDDQIQSTEVIRYGKVWFKTAANGEAVLHLLLDHKEVSKKQITDVIEYLLDSGWLTTRNFSTKKETRLQLVQPGQKMNLFQLGKGPFPLPIGQDPKDVRGQFDVTIPAPDKDDPKGTVHLVLKPKAGNRLAESFLAIEVWVDDTTKMPVQILTQNKNQTELKIWNFVNLKVNTEINHTDLALPPLEKGWDSMDQPLAAPGQ